MHFSKLIFSILALAAVSVSANPLPAKAGSHEALPKDGVKIPRPVAAATQSCEDWCPTACYYEFGSYSYYCISGYGLYDLMHN
jgi:hypothetical protein